MSEKTLEPRVVALETKLDTVVSGLHELTKAVREIAGRPQTIAWREIAFTAGAFLALFAYVGNYLEGQYAKNIAVEKYRIEQLEKQVRLLAPIAGALVIGKSKD